jgi:hypothetical protein
LSNVVTTTADPIDVVDAGTLGMARAFIEDDRVSTHLALVFVTPEDIEFSDHLNTPFPFGLGAIKSLAIALASASFVVNFEVNDVCVPSRRRGRCPATPDWSLTPLAVDISGE